MAQEIITLECTEAKALGKPVSRYMSTRNKKSPRTPNRLEKKKYNPFLKKHTLHRETRWSHATKDRQTPLRLSTRKSHHATPPHRYRGGSNRLQESRFAEKVCDRERENFAAANHRHAGAHAPEDHARDQTQPFCAADEVAAAGVPGGRGRDATAFSLPARGEIDHWRNTDFPVSAPSGVLLRWRSLGKQPGEFPAGRTGHWPAFRAPNCPADYPTRVLVRGWGGARRWSKRRYKSARFNISARRSISAKVL